MLEKVLPRKTRSDAIPDETIAKALKATQGRMYHAAEQLGVTGSAVADRVKESPYLQKVKDECIQKRIDTMEKGLQELAEEKNLGAICFGLKTIGKSRGYSESVPVYVAPEFAASLAQTMQLFKANQALKIEDSNEIRS